MKARRLSKNATIGVIAPGSPVDPKRFEAGKKELEHRGFRIRCPIDPGKHYGDYTHGFASASVEDRARVLRELFEDKDVEAVLAARGAYGSPELLPKIDFPSIGKTKKLLIGCSDVTALLLPLYSQGKVFSIHGPTLSGDFARASESSDAKAGVDALIHMLMEQEYLPELSASLLREGKAEGWLLVGNLTMLLNLLGTPWDMDYSGAILVLEDVGEAPYRIHRALTHLKLAGKLERISALIFGRFSRCEATQGPSVQEVIKNSVKDILAETRYPVLMDLQIGHNGINLPLPLGCRAVVEGPKLRLLEAPVE